MRDGAAGFIPLGQRALATPPLDTEGWVKPCQCQTQTTNYFLKCSGEHGTSINIQVYSLDIFKYKNYSTQ